MVFITHSIPEAVFVADRVPVMAPRPGHIADIVPVDNRWSRSPDVMNTGGFGEFVRRIRAPFSGRGGSTKGFGGPYLRVLLLLLVLAVWEAVVLYFAIPV